MKTLYNAIIAISLLFGCASCDDYLDVTQPSVYTDQNYYKTPQDFETAVNGCYAQLQSIYNRNYLEAIVTRGDEVRNSCSIGRFMDTSLESGWSKAWSSWWTLVFRCNQVLSRIDGVEFSDTGRKDNLSGEAYAMRGLAYLQFAWCWGGAPLIVSELPQEEVYKVKRATQEETYAQAVADFKKAFELLPEQWQKAEVGRVTKYAAAGMLGRTYMYMHEFAAAKEQFELVVGQEGALYQLADKYEDCFSDVYNNGKERVWEVQYLGGAAGKSLGLSQRFSGWFIPSQLDKRDYEKLNGVNFVGASGSIRASVSLSGDDEKPEEYPSAYEEGDARKDATIVNGLYGDKSIPQKPYYVIKFLRATKVPAASYDEWGNNIPILRYTDVKMMYAEALNELDCNGNMNKILSIINEVRKRAGLAEKTAADFADKQAVFDYIVKDRFVEFCFEGIRWPDLVRWNLAEEAMEKHFEMEDEGYNKTTGQPLYHMNSYNVLAPIPLSDILAYGDKNVMWQNDGY